uniref:Uncharacterized protein n=1 Tax=Mucochytrium quahogii TaxID=96639 RepID=A0A7S2RIX9_9STRA|mmetsp:Transcript_12432/g.20129  ORF Transcript_12432/g.20129 Transcript_12432/m.20129 type:complete len:427 (-) Transcript_12432:82-1362(-)
MKLISSTIALAACVFVVADAKTTKVSPQVKAELPKLAVAMNAVKTPEGAIVAHTLGNAVGVGASLGGVQSILSLLLKVISFGMEFHPAVNSTGGLEHFQNSSATIIEVLISKTLSKQASGEALIGASNALIDMLYNPVYDLMKNGVAPVIMPAVELMGPVGNIIKEVKRLIADYKNATKPNATTVMYLDATTDLLSGVESLGGEQAAGKSVLCKAEPFVHALDNAVLMLAKGNVNQTLDDMVTFVNTTVNAFGMTTIASFMGLFEMLTNWLKSLYPKLKSMGPFIAGLNGYLEAKCNEKTGGRMLAAESFIDKIENGIIHAVEFLENLLVKVNVFLAKVTPEVISTMEKFLDDLVQFIASQHQLPYYEDMVKTVGELVGNLQTATPPLIQVLNITANNIIPSLFDCLPDLIQVVIGVISAVMNWKN